MKYTSDHYEKLALNNVQTDKQFSAITYAILCLAAMLSEKAHGT